MSNKNQVIKAKIIDELALKLQNCQSFLIYEYAGLNAKDTTELRSNLRNNGAKMVIYKNNILNRALIKSGIMLDANFIGPNAIALGDENIQPLKDIAKLQKKHNFIKLKAALVEKNLIMGADLNNFATLPTKNDLYAMFCQCLHSPLRQLMQVVKKVGEAKA